MTTKFINEPFGDEERRLMEAVESGNFRSVPKEEFESTIREIRAGSAAKVVSIRMQGDDLGRIREIAKTAGLPYQTLINSVIHRYVTGALVPKAPI